MRRRIMANYEVDILVNGKPIKKFRKGGDTFIEGRKGSNFELRFINNTMRRVEIIASVDGLSVIDGNPCGSNSEGYVVSARDSIVIPGWRLHNDAVAGFVFNDKDRSYTAQMGHGKHNAGVIGFMVFEEEYKTTYIPSPYPRPLPQPWPHPRPLPMPDPWQPYGPYWNWGTTNIKTGGSIPLGTSSDSVNIVSESTEKSSDTKSADSSVRTFGASSVSISASGASVQSHNMISQNEGNETFELGTGWGDEQEHHVTLVEFNRRDLYNATEILTVFYDTRKGLENRGIKVVMTKTKKTKTLPNAFPTYSGTGATPPPRWKGKRR